MKLIKEQLTVNRNATTDFLIPEMKVETGEKDADGKWEVGDLVIYGKICTHDDNPGLRDGMNRKFANKSKRRLDGKKLMQSVRELFPVYGIIDWNIHDKGKKVKYNAKLCKEQIFDKLTVYTIQDILEHFTDPANFMESLTKEDGDDLGNSSGK